MEVRISCEFNRPVTARDRVCIHDTKAALNGRTITFQFGKCNAYPRKKAAHVVDFILRNPHLRNTAITLDWNEIEDVTLMLEKDRYSGDLRPISVQVAQVLSEGLLDIRDKIQIIGGEAV